MQIPHSKVKSNKKAEQFTSQYLSRSYAHDFEREVTLKIEMAPTVFTVVNHIQKSNAYSPWIELPHFNSDVTSASSVKERTPLLRSQ